MSSLFNNAAWGGVSAAVRLTFGMANLFIAIRLAGAENYGYIALILSISTIYLTVVNSVNTIAVTHAAEFKRSKNKEVRILELFSAVWMFTLIAIITILIASLMFSEEFISTFIYWGANIMLTQELELSLFLIVGLLVCQLINAANIAVIESLGKFDLAARAQSFGPILAFILFVKLFLDSENAKITSVISIFFAAGILDMILTTFVRVRLGYMSAYRLRFRSLVMLPTLLKGGASLQGSRLVNVFVDPLNKYLLNLYVGSASVTVYEVAMKVITGIQGLFGGAFRSFLQLTEEMRGNSGLEYLKSLRYGLVPALILHVIAGVVIIFISKFWLSKTTDVLPLLLFSMIPASMMIIFIAPLYFALIGIRDLKFIFNMNLNLAILNVIGSLICIPLIGVMGCAVGFTVAILHNAVMEYRRYENKVGVIKGLKNEMIGLSSKFLVILIAGGVSLLAHLLLDKDVYLIGIETLILALLLFLLIKEPFSNKLFGKVTAFLGANNL